MTTPADKIAGAPISWGVCEVPGWGYQLEPGRVLAEMQQVGLAATEFGPDGFLPADPARMAEFLAAHHLTAVGGFTPFIVTLLYAAFGWIGAATLFGVYGAIGLIATLITKETFGPTERAAANQNDESMRVDA